MRGRDSDGALAWRLAGRSAWAWGRGQSGCGVEARLSTEWRLDGEVQPARKEGLCRSGLTLRLGACGRSRSGKPLVPGCDQALTEV
jgi:hypothetical protein